MVLGSWTRALFSHPKNSIPSSQRQTGHHTERDRLRNNLQIIPGSSRIGHDSCSICHPRQIHRHCSQGGPEGRRNVAVSNSQRKALYVALLIQFCYGSCNSEARRERRVEVERPGERLRLCSALLCPVIIVLQLAWNQQRRLQKRCAPQFGTSDCRKLRRRVESSIGSGRHPQYPPSV
jgi:hypothetical protein